MRDAVAQSVPVVQGGPLALRGGAEKAAVHACSEHAVDACAYLRICQAIYIAVFTLGEEKC